MGPHCQDRIEKKYALLCPLGQASRLRQSASHIVMQFSVNIDQRRRDLLLVLRDREAESVRLMYIVIGILSQDHHLHFVKRGQMEGIKDLICRRKHSIVRVFLPHELIQIPVIRLFKFFPDGRQPVSGDLCHLSPRFSGSFAEKKKQVSPHIFHR